MTYNLVLPTDPLLNQAANRVAAADIDSAEVQHLIDGMLGLAAGKGHDAQDSRQMVGLAAPQLGVAQCIVIIDITADGSQKEQHLQVFINPIITRCSAETLPGREGCWSCSSICGNVRRAKEVTLEALDRHGKPLSISLTGFVARIAQHEVDHLAGIRFPDRIPLSKPERLHWVEPADFPAYRVHWASWSTLCPREQWEALKAGVSST